MIQLQSLTKAFGDQVLFEAVTWQISARERVALSGPNGAGKTTLLRILAGLDEADRGTVIKPAGLLAGYLPQDGLVHAGRSLFDETSSAFQPLLDLKNRMHAVETDLADPQASPADHQHLLDEYSDLQETFHRQEGYTIDLRVATVLRGLGFTPEDFPRQTETFSGGWQMRIALAKLLLQRPGLLLLDEPTNHLDLESRNWLEEYLRSYSDAVILVSHDRYFLDAVSTRITEIALRTLTDYTGNYSSYLLERAARLERLREAKRRQDEDVARIRQFVDRFRYQATKASQVQSRLKMLQKITPIEVPPERKRVRFSFPRCRRSGRVVLELQRASKRYDKMVVLSNIDLLVERGDRTALVGPNGAGKSTLMRLLASAESPDAGTHREGHHVVTQYFPQDQATRLDPNITVYETLASNSPTQMVPAIRTVLGGFLFSGDDVYKRVRVLSGGERTRLAVARMLLHPANLLLLDEPTNHLDLDSKEVLLEALEDFGGTLVFVSHDRYFVERLATKIVEVGNGRATLYPGTYPEFLWSKNRSAAAAPTPVTAPQKTVSAPRSRGPNGPVDRRAQAAQRARRREAQAHQARLATLEEQITECEHAIKELEATMASPGFYDDHVTARALIDKHQTLMWKVGDLLHRWEELQIAQTDDTPSD